MLRASLCGIAAVLLSCSTEPSELRDDPPDLGLSDGSTDSELLGPDPVCTEGGCAAFPARTCVERDVRCPRAVIHSALGDRTCRVCSDDCVIVFQQIESLCAAHERPRPFDGGAVTTGDAGFGAPSGDAGFGPWQGSDSGFGSADGGGGPAPDGSPPQTTGDEPWICPGHPHHPACEAYAAHYCSCLGGAATDDCVVTRTQSCNCAYDQCSGQLDCETRTSCERRSSECQRCQL